MWRKALLSEKVFELIKKAIENNNLSGDLRWEQVYTGLLIKSIICFEFDNFQALMLVSIGENIFDLNKDLTLLLAAAITDKGSQSIFSGISFLKKFAKEKGCTRIVGYTLSKALIEMTKRQEGAKFKAYCTFPV